MMVIRFLCGFIFGHDFFNGGESCRDCRQPRGVQMICRCEDYNEDDDLICRYCGLDVEDFEGPDRFEDQE